jgi:outer membrane protein assembly factor BamB
VGAFTTVPAISGSRIVAATQDGLLRCFFLITGDPMWEHRLTHPLEGAPVTDADGRVFLGTSDGWIESLSVSSGRRLWRWRIGARTPHSGVIVGGRYCVASYDAAMHALDRRSGHQIWRAALPSRPLASPLVQQDIVFVLCYGDMERRSTLVAADAATGKRLGVFEINGEALGAALLVKAHFVVPLRDGTIVSLALAAPPDRSGDPRQTGPAPDQKRGQPAPAPEGPQPR